MSQNCYLGFDISTQQVKLIAIDDSLSVIYEDNVQFDRDLPEFGTEGGVHFHVKDQSATSPTLMWVKALDIILLRLKNAPFDISRVVSVSGAGQQHGSVFWAKGASKMLSTLSPDKPLFDQLLKGFSVPDSPIWMDSSTEKYCKRLEQAVGGPERLADLTGSRAYERFTGNQIAKIADVNPAAYKDTEHISLVSSFGASLLIGKYARIDEADGAGMNLMNIKTKRWVDECLKSCALDLETKLGDIVPSCTTVGNISSYMVDRYGFTPDCKVVAFTGDNPASLAGMRLKPNELIVSLGTSDTLFLWLDEPTPALEGHIFGNPVDQSAYMALLCYKNGSLLRERIRDECAEGKWSRFEDLLQSSPRGNNGNIGIYYDVAEITPSNACGTFRFNRMDEPVAQFDKPTEIRAAIEGQFLAKRVHAENIGITVNSQNGRILATGGASASKAILQVLSDVFNLPVFVLDIPNSAALGCAYRARHAWIGAGTPFADTLKDAPEFMCVARPHPDAERIYTDMTRRYKQMEERHIRNNVSTQVLASCD